MALHFAAVSGSAGTPQFLSLYTRINQLCLLPAVHISPRQQHCILLFRFNIYSTLSTLCRTHFHSTSNFHSSPPKQIFLSTTAQYAKPLKNVPPSSNSALPQLPARPHPHSPPPACAHRPRPGNPTPRLRHRRTHLDAASLTPHQL